MTFKNAESPTRPRRAAGPASREGRYRSGASRRPTGRRLFGQVGSVLTDLPLFLTAPLYRRWHRRWGSTADEVASVMPGDDLFLKAQFISTRSITIDAPPAAVWPWLVQVGCGRAGFYSNDLLDNLGRPSATTIVPELQHLQVGQWVPMSRRRLPPRRRRSGWTPTTSPRGCSGRSRTAPGRGG